MHPSLPFLPLHQNPSLSLSTPLHSQRHQLQYNPYVSSYSTITTAPPATTPLTSAPVPSHPPTFTFFTPAFMDPGPTLANPPATTNNTTAASPTTSNASVLSATVVNAQPQPSSKKKQGRGPGKKDLKDKPAVSVRWDDGDLTDRLIAAVESNDRWLGVFAQPSNDPNAARTAAPVAKRDLQREIARYLFGKDPRYDLDDRKVLESLAVSVKNKLFKLTTLYTECKQELGQLSTLKDERELIPGSDAAATWARVKEKLPQFTRIRELMGRVSSPGSTPRASGPDASASPPHVRHSPTSPVLRQRDTNVVPLTNGQVPHRTSTLKGAVDFPRDASYTDPSSSPARYATAQAAMSISTIPSPTYTISHSTMPLSAGYPTGHSSQRRMTSSSTAPPNSSRPSTAVSQAASARHHSPQHFTSVHTATASAARPTPYHRPSLPAATMNEIQAHLQTALDIVPEYDDPRDPSPPLSATIQHIVTVLTERKERERSRAHELEMLRMKREEADKSRWHQREMMRLKIQLLRAERAASANPVSTSTPGAGPSQLGGVEEDLAIAAGLGDDMSMEGDGEGELDEDIYDPEPGSRPGQPLAHHGGAGTR